MSVGIAAFYKIPSDLVIKNGWVPEEPLPVDNWVNSVDDGNKKREAEPGFWVHAKKSFNDFAVSTTCHGLPRIVDEKEPGFVRLMWVLAVVLFLAVTSFTVYQSTLSTLVNPTFSTELVPKNFSVGQLPAIHICDSSLFNKTILKGYGIDDELASYMMLSMGPTIINSPFVRDSKRQMALQRKLDAILSNYSTSLVEILDNATLKCENMVNSCIVNSVSYPSLDCCSKFFGSFSSLMGGCVSTYYARENVSQLFESQFFGFVVFLRGNPDPVDFDTSIVSSILSARKGFVYSASDVIDHPAVWLQSYGQLTSIGQWVSLSITKSEVDMSDIKTSYIIRGSCAQRFGTEYSQLAPSYETYSAKNCRGDEFSTSLAFEVLNKNCTFYGLPRKGNTTLCNPSDVVQLHSNLNSRKKNATSNATKESPPLSKCVDDCVYEEYTLSPSSMSLDTQTTASVSQFDTGALKDSALALHFYYKSFTYTSIVRHYPSVITWIGEVGGNLGLFLGSSIMTFIEIIVLCYHCCFKKR